MCASEEEGRNGGEERGRGRIIAVSHSNLEHDIKWYQRLCLEPLVELGNMMTFLNFKFCDQRLSSEPFDVSGNMVIFF